MPIEFVWVAVVLIAAIGVVLFALLSKDESVEH